MFSIVLIIAGFAGLMAGGTYLVQGAVDIALRLRVSPLVIGLTLVGFGTSMPELVTSVQAAFAGSPGIALGNIIGSNTANILLILGVAALICPLAVQRQALNRDGSVLFIATLAFCAVILSGLVGRTVGAAFLVALAVYLVLTLRWSRAEGQAEDFALPTAPLWRNLAMLLGGLALTIVAARMLVSGATDIARALNVSEAVIGLTIVAIGTSLPELVTSAVAARKGQGDMALGNILGSNIFNILGILGVTAVLRPMDVPARLAGIDIWVMAAATLLLLVLARSGWRISRAEGALLLALYAGYTAMLGLTA